jgi:hypothetical protein
MIKTALLLEFENLTDMRDSIGIMLLAYGEIEFGLLRCVGVVLNEDHDTAARILFRARGETARIEIADALVRPPFAKVGLGGKWSNAYGAAKICKNIRNQYAHCHWHQELLGNVVFLDFDQDSQKPEGSLELTRKSVTPELVAEQLKYFEYCVGMLWHIEPEYRKRANLKLVAESHEPKSVPAPRLYIQSN